MRILVIEDSPPTRDLLRRTLEGAAHQVTLAARASTGHKLAACGGFDVIVLDVMLPDLDGMSLCRQLRSDGITTPVLFLTARGEVSDRIAGLDAGADDYLRKPFALAEFLARVRALGRRQSTIVPKTIAWRTGRLDLTSRKCECNGQPVSLTAREWGVLEVLTARRGHAVPREDILLLVWNDAGPASSSILDVVVSRLRRKLAGAAGEALIRTVRGEGYVFEAFE